MQIIRAPWVDPQQQAAVERCCADVRALLATTPLHTPEVTAFLATVTIAYSRRMVGTAGTANLRTQRITLNARLLAQHPEALQPTFLHELAHLLTYKFHKHHGHGRPWQIMMLQLGQAPQRCHRLDVSGLRRSRKRPKSLQQRASRALARLIFLETTRRLRAALDGED